MRVLVDFTQIPLSRTGVGVYAEHLVENLIPLLHASDVLIVLIQSDEAAVLDMARGKANVQLLSIPASIFRNRFFLMVFEQLVLPIVAWRKRVNLIHSLHYTHPLLAFTSRVVTIHDLTFLLFPEMHTRGRRSIIPFFIRRAMKHAEAIIFVSKATQNDAERMLPGGRNLRCAVPLGVSLPLPIYTEETRSEEVLADMGVGSPYLLFIGTLEPRKNIVRIVQAFERIAIHYPNLILVLAGKLGWHTGEIVAAMENSPVRERIKHLGFVSEEEKASLLRNCEMLVYPSMYEGFGLPVLEAMAAGAPVITSNLSSMPEVAGDAAVLVDPSSVDKIADAMQQILDDKAFASSLRKTGCAQAQSFTWSRMAEQTDDVYRSVIKCKSQSKMQEN